MDGIGTIPGAGTMADEYTESIYHDPSTQTPTAPEASEGAEQPQASTAPPTREEMEAESRLNPSKVYGFTNPDGTLTMIQGGESRTYADPIKTSFATDAADISVKQRLAEIRARRGSRIVTVTFGGEDWHIKMFNLGDLDEWALLTARAGDGTLQLRNDGVMQSMQVAALQVAVVKGAKDMTPYFDPEPYEVTNEFGEIYLTTEAEEWIAEPEYLELNAFLWDAITNINPSMVPGKKKAMAEISPPKLKTKKKYAEKQSGPASLNTSSSAKSALSMSPTGSAG